MELPKWVLKHKKKGQEIRLIRGKYYLYAVSSHWDKNRRKAIKTTKYIGKLTEENGLIEKKTNNVNNKLLVSAETVSTKRYGDVYLVENDLHSLQKDLEKHFDKEVAEYILCLAFFKLTEQSPFKRMENYYNNSFISEIFPKLSFNKNNITLFLSRLGNNRENILKFMNDAVEDCKSILFDGCGITTKSQNMDINRVGYNGHREFDPQINLMYGFSTDKQKPTYYRINSGNIKDVSSFVTSIKESKISKVDVVADKGFASEKNLLELEKNNINYVIPLRRSSTHFDDRKIREGNKNVFDAVFMYNNRAVWHYSTMVQGRYLHTFVDDALKIKESDDYLRRVESKLEKYTMEGYYENQYKFGTILLVSNKYSNAQKAYEVYKTRLEIEEMFDCLKNFMEADKIYMQNDIALEGWAFINHIAMLLLYGIYAKLRNAELLKKYSPKDLIEYLKNIQKLKIDNEWNVINLSVKTKEILKKLGLPMA
jgi:transposase